MRIGFSTIYSWRPHVEHCFFLATLACKAGHETYFFQCNGDLQCCYNRELKGGSKWLQCQTCKLGNLGTFTKANITRISDYPPETAHHKDFNRNWVSSSASTLGRFESDDDYQSLDFSNISERLLDPCFQTYSSARQWIVGKKLDAVCVFNGRIDHTRAVFEAAKSEGVRVISIERPWFSRGIQMYPEEHCLGLQTVHRIVAEYAHRPLSKDQALVAASYAAKRILRMNSDEWRAYNANAIERQWPLESKGARILILPSSRNEIWGHPDWASAWSEPTAGFDAVLDKLGVSMGQVVLRRHPNWSERIGKANGDKIDNYYNQWAKQRGILTISGDDKANTLNLIKQADIILLGNSSAAFEAGVLSKTIVATGPSSYSQAGFAFNIHCKETLDAIPNATELWTKDSGQKKETARQALRYVYTMTRRMPQYVNAVVPKTPTQMLFDMNAEAARFIDLLCDGILQADDDTYVEDETGENEVCALMANHRWSDILKYAQSISLPATGLQPLARMPIYKAIGRLREWLPRGDQ